MNAADGIKKLEQTEAWKRLVTPRNIVLVALAVLIPASCYVKGRHDEAAMHERAERSSWHQLVDSANHLRDSAERLEIARTEATTDARHARQSYTKAASRLTITGKEIAIDGGEPAPVVPASVVIPVIQSANDALLKDSLALAVAASVITVKDHEIAIDDARVALAEEQAKQSMGLKAKAKIAGVTILALGALKLGLSALKVFK